jgi:hypothetical protein
MSGNSAQVNAATANKIVLTGFVPFFLKFARQFQALWNSPKKAPPARPDWCHSCSLCKTPADQWVCDLGGREREHRPVLGEDEGNWLAQLFTRDREALWRPGPYQLSKVARNHGT